MASFLNDSVLDAALEHIRSTVDALHICNALPSAIGDLATMGLGNKGTPTLGAVGDRTGGGRKFTVSAITDGSVTATDTATHWALVDTGTAIRAAQTLTAPQAVTSGNVFTLSAFDVGFPDAA